MGWAEREGERWKDRKSNLSRVEESHAVGEWTIDTNI